MENCYYNNIITPRSYIYAIIVITNDYKYYNTKGATLDHWITNYLNDCRYRKHLDVKTLRAYRSDLNEFTTYIVDQDVDFLNKHSISAYVNDLHKNKSPRTVKRKIASLHAFYRYLVYEELVESDPFYRLDLTFRHSFPVIFRLIC